MASPRTLISPAKRGRTEGHPQTPTTGRNTARNTTQEQEEQRICLNNCLKTHGEISSIMETPTADHDKLIAFANATLQNQRLVNSVLAAHPNDRPAAHNALKDILQRESYDDLRLIEQLGGHAVPQGRTAVNLNSERAAGLLHSTPTEPERAKHVPCPVSGAEYAKASPLQLILDVLGDVNKEGLHKGWLTPGSGGQPPGEGWIIAGGCPNNLLQPTLERRPVIANDVDAFLCGATSAINARHLLRAILDALAPYVKASMNQIITERAVTITLKVPAGTYGPPCMPRVCDRGSRGPHAMLAATVPAARSTHMR